MNGFEMCVREIGWKGKLFGEFLINVVLARAPLHSFYSLKFILFVSMEASTRQSLEK